MTGSADLIAASAIQGFELFRVQFDEITDKAGGRFSDRDWSALQEDATERLQLYSARVQAVANEIQDKLGPTEREAWVTARSRYAEALQARTDTEVGETFFSSLSRKVLGTIGTDPAIEFTDAEPAAISGEPDLISRPTPERTHEKLFSLLTATLGGDGWQNLGRDVRLATLEIERRFTSHGQDARATAIEVCAEPFYRGRAAYIVGTITSGDVVLPVAVAVHHTMRGLVIGSILLEPDDISVLFSYTRSSFLVRTRSPGQMVNYLRRLIPHRKAAELYSAIGFNKHGKTERYRDLRKHISESGESFEYARGITGMVMIVFTLPGYDAVFKVIRDRFPYPKQTTRRQVMAKYRLVFGHDRAGRLIDAHEFEHMKFDRSQFGPELLQDLEQNASRSVTVTPDSVTLHHVYVERKVIPLDIYLREANPLKGRAAIVDYGRSIKDLAMSDIFPGDMLLKNFGVTRSGRVVFYDYDELTRVTECNFREMPQTADPDREMSAEPWFGVGDHDVFPEEFRSFLGIRGELRDVLEQHHGDLFGVRFWTRVQSRIEAGEVIEIFPYERRRRLGAGVRRRTSEQ